MDRIEVVHCIFTKQKALGIKLHITIMPRGRDEAREGNYKPVCLRILLWDIHPTCGPSRCLKPVTDEIFPNGLAIMSALSRRRPHAFHCKKGPMLIVCCQQGRMGDRDGSVKIVTSDHAYRIRTSRNRGPIGGGRTFHHRQFRHCHASRCCAGGNSGHDFLHAGTSRVHHFLSGLNRSIPHHAPRRIPQRRVPD